MLNKNDKKGIFAVILVLIAILVVFSITRSCEHNEREPIANIEDTPIINEQIEEEVIEEEGKEDPGQSEDVSISNPIYNEIVEEEKEENKYPVINIEQDYYTVSYGSDFTIPQIEALDDTGNSLKISITYSFKSLDDSEFIPTLEFSTRKLGIYKITYYVENVNHYVSTKDIYVEILDDISPSAEGIITKYNEVEDAMEFLPVINGSVINTSIDISFSDNDIVSYVEYYNASIDNTITGDTLEQEAMPTVTEVDPTSILTLTDEGEYHIRIYDRSGNVSEYVVTIDLTLPTIEVEYEQVSEDLVLVTITSDEEMNEIDGFILSSDKKVLTKVYNLSILEDLTLEDLAGNKVLIHLEYEGLKVDVTQNDISTANRTLNRNDGDIKLILTGQGNIEVTYTVDDGLVNTYTSGDVLTQDGYYKFLINHDGYETILELSISSMGTSD